MKHPSGPRKKAAPRHPILGMVLKRKQMVVYAPRTGNCVIILIRHWEWILWGLRVQRVRIPGVKDRGSRDPHEDSYLMWPRAEIEYFLSKVELLPSSPA